MPKTLVLTSVLLITAFAGWLPTSQAVALDQSWMTPGFTLAYAATPGAFTTVNPTQPTVSGTFPVTFVVAGVTGTSVTFDLVEAGVGSTLVQQVTYDRATRLGPEGGSLLWINPSDIAAGQADFAGRTAILLVNTPALVEFSDGQSDYYFNAVTGLLTRGENLFTGSSLTATGAALGVVPAADNSGQATVAATIPVALPVEASPVPPPGGVQAQGFGEVQRSCRGQVTTSPFGGTDSCGMSTFWALDAYQLQPYVLFPTLGQGTVSGSVADVLGVYATWSCTASSPVLTSSDIGCVSAQSRPFFPGPQFPKGQARFNYCLNPLTLFSCPWETGFTATGDVF